MTGQELKAWRKGLKMTQVEAATEMGLCRRAYQALEMGERPIYKMVERSCRDITVEKAQNG